MSSHFTYFIILGLSLAGPLLLSFDKKVAFYKKWKFLFPAMLFPALFYIVWDSYFTYTGVWSFNDNYISGIKLFHLPIEEILFFFVVPYCCVFIYECIICYFPLIRDSEFSIRLLIILGVVFTFAGCIFYNRIYTSSTLLLCGFFIGLLFLFRNTFRKTNVSTLLISYLIILIPFLIVNGFLTAIPVVIYNNEENSGVRIYTIPIEDIIYGFLLVMQNVVLYEFFKALQLPSSKKL